MNRIIYKIKTATVDEINSHLNECNNNFIPPLIEKVDIKEYSKKIADKSITFEAWDNNKLIGLIAVYLNNTENKSGFITSVSTMNEYKGRGIASQLMNMCIDYSKKNNFKEILLEVSEKNVDAFRLYKKFKFEEIEINNGTRTMKLELNKK